MEIPFKIEHIDPLGQGVSKSGNNITFIKKTLPGEVGLANIFRSAKGVQFAEVTKLEHVSPLRIAAECPHYSCCNSCHYLHTSYQNELEYKRLAYTRLLNQKNKIEIHPANKRLGYRNRIQLHYDSKKLGYIYPGKKEIIEVPHCQLPLPSIQKEILRLYHNQQWKKLLGKHISKGHIEIYHPPHKSLQVTINRGYSEGGFSQVNPEMNNTLVGIVEKNHCGKTILDLFGGDGNLSHTIKCKNKWIIDRYKAPEKKGFINCDLFSLSASTFLQKTVQSKVDYMILDPPRSGFKGIRNFTNDFTPHRIIYVSCNMATQMRDLKTINDQYQITECHLVDLFPSTAHFESLIILDRS